MTGTLPLAPAAPASPGERSAGPWLLLESALAFSSRLPASPEPSPETLLAWNAKLAGSAKFVLDPLQRIILRAELPKLDGGVSLEAAAATSAGFTEAHRLWRHGAELPPAAPLAPFPEALTQSLLQVGEESGWPVRERADGLLVADLEHNGGHRQASLHPWEDGTLALAELAVLDAAAAEARAAVSLLLLTAGAAIRWARPVVRVRASRTVAAFEVWLPASPSAGALAEALGALSVASRMAGAEASALLDAAAARAFLQISGPFPDSIINHQRKE